MTYDTNSRKVAALRKRWQKLCEDAVELARESGATEPNIYMEAEGGFVVVDGDTHDGPDGFQRSAECVVFGLGWPDNVEADCGAW